MRAIDHQFGTLRGAVRLALAHVQTAGGVGKIDRKRLRDVRRLVFVCQGNICRSAFAEAVARKFVVEAASVGLSTGTGGPAHPPVIEHAKSMGYDLSAHRTTSIADYTPRAGDLLLAMEVRQVAALDRDPRFANTPKGLLGQWAQPWLHLHDPYLLNDDYLRRCLQRIERAVATLSPLIVARPSAAS